MTVSPRQCQLTILAFPHGWRLQVGIGMGWFSEQRESGSHSSSCLNTLVNSCQQGGHSAKGQGHLSCVQLIDIVPFHLTPLHVLSLHHFPSWSSSPLFPSVLLFLHFLSTSASLLFWWKGENMQGTDMISSLISVWWMAPAPLLI